MLLALAAACTEGTTPNCADPNVQCGPDLDGSASEAGDAADATSDSAAEADAETGADADADAPADASDAG